MSIRLFMDHCVPRSAANRLREAGHKVVLLTDQLPADARDPDVLKEATRLDALLVSLNGDFADIVTYPPSRFGGIISLQIHNQPSLIDLTVQRLVDYLQRHNDRESHRGKLIIVEPYRIRIRQ